MEKDIKNFLEFIKSDKKLSNNTFRIISKRYITI